MKFSFVFHGALVLGIGINSVHIFDVDDTHFSAMFYFYAIAWTQTSILYLFMFRAIDAAKAHCTFFGICHALLAIAAFFMGWFGDSDNAEIFFGILLFLVLLTHFCTIFMKSLQLSINLHHYTERHGLLIIILLGEGIISLVSPEVRVDLDQYVLVFGGYLAISCIYFLYFEFQPKSMPQHGLRSGGRAFVWIISHLLLHPAILAMCIGFKMMLKYEVKYYEQEHDIHRRFLGDSGGGAVGSAELLGDASYGSDSYGYDSGYSSGSYYSKYDEYPTSNQEKLLYWGIFASFQLVGFQWFSHFFYWRKFCQMQNPKENLIVLSWVLHSVALIFPLYSETLSRVNLVVAEACICFSGLVTNMLFELFAGKAHKINSVNGDSDSEVDEELSDVRCDVHSEKQPSKTKMEV